MAQAALLGSCIALVACGDEAGDEEQQAGETTIAGSLDGAGLSFATAAYGISLHQADPILRRIEVRFSADACSTTSPPVMPYLTVWLAHDASGTLEVQGRILQSLDAEATPIDADGTAVLDVAEVTGIPDDYTEAPFPGVAGSLAGSLDLLLRTFDINAPEGGTGEPRGELQGSFFADHCLELDGTHFE